jgi:hypothetical protein
MKIDSSNDVRKSRDPTRGAGAYGVVQIDHSITEDLPDGRPTLPAGENEIFWSLVERLPDGMTRWRQIIVRQTATSQEAAP